MSKELLLVVDAVAHEKDLDKSRVFGALESALLSVVRKREETDALLKIHLDRDTGEVHVERHWHIRDNAARLENPNAEIRLMDVDETLTSDMEVRRSNQVLSQDVSHQAGDVLVAFLPNPLLDRIAAQTTKQVLLQKLREADRDRTVEEFLNRQGEILTGVVKRIEKGQIYLDLGSNREGLVPSRHQIKGERFKVGERVRAYLNEVNAQGPGPALLLSRTVPEFVLGLMQIEVPEAGSGVIRFHGCARDPGDRAKVAVSSSDSRLDPVGACIGMRGSRIQAVSSDLHGERIDIVLWDESPAQFVINAMQPGEVNRLVVDEERHIMDVAVSEANLARAIGRGGQNVRLASRLTGWTLNVQDEKTLDEKQRQDENQLRKTLMESLFVDEEVADILIQEGFSSVEEIAFVPLQELLSVEGFDEELVEVLRERARDSLVTSALQEEEDSVSQADESLQALSSRGLPLIDMQALISVDVDSGQKLAELSIDEVLDLLPEWESRKDEVALWISWAREPWLKSMKNDSLV